MTVAVIIFDDGRGLVERQTTTRRGVHRECLAEADTIPDLRFVVSDLSIDGVITRHEADELHADIDADCDMPRPPTPSINDIVGLGERIAATEAA